MKGRTRNLLGRRNILKSSAAVLGGAFLGKEPQAFPKNVNTSSGPSGLKITDLRVAVLGGPRAIIRLDNRGYITVPDKPGLGVSLNEDAVKKHLAPGAGYFEPTTEWDKEHSWDRLWS